MKAYTDINQSKKLADILSIESADMKWFTPADNESEFIEEVSLINNKSEYTLFNDVVDWYDTPYIPCWSLAALLDVLPEGIIENYYAPNLQKENGKYSIAYGDDKLLCIADNPIDACYAMIIKLHEQKLI